MNIFESLVQYASDLVDKVVNYSDREDAKTSALSEIESFISNYNYTGLSEPTMPESVDLGESTSYERLEYEEKTSEELASIAEESLSAYLNSGVNSINSTYDNYISDLESDEVKAVETTENSIVDAQSDYEKSVEENNYSALKNGIARSSIITNQNEEALSTKDTTVESLEAGLSSQKDAIAEEIIKLTEERDSALADFDLTYAVKLTDAINDLIEDQQDEINSVIKYNNTLTEKEFDDNIELESTASDLYQEQLEAYYQALEIYNEEAQQAMEVDVYTKILEVLDSLPASDAKSLVVESEYIKENLSTYYYSLLYDSYVR